MNQINSVGGTALLQRKGKKYFDDDGDDDMSDDLSGSSSSMVDEDPDFKDDSGAEISGDDTEAADGVSAGSGEDDSSSFDSSFLEAKEKSPISLVGIFGHVLNLRWVNLRYVFFVLGQRRAKLSREGGGTT